MRKYANLKEPLKCGQERDICRIMLCEAEEGFYLFGYADPDAACCSFDRCYASAEDLYDDWNDLIDENGWIDLEDPMPGCQQDAFFPLRVKGRDAGKPEWGKYETLKDGKWVAYEPAQSVRPERSERA